MRPGTPSDVPDAPPSRKGIPLTSPVAAGDVINGKYRVDHVLGVGGMGVVVAATHLELDERVAIKLLHSDAADVPDLVTRFSREARAAVRIKSEHVARVTDVGSLDGGLPFMVMEYLAGRDLGVLARDKGSLSVEEVLDYVLQACEAVAEAHALGIVHRDLKPSNLFVSTRADGSRVVKVLDFGISKFVRRDPSMPDASMTQTAAVIGSPVYMSPEQMESTRDADERSDIWAIGVILYELLTGAPPFEAPTMPQLCAKILKAEPTPVRTRRADVPPELEAVILRCLAKAPAARFQTLADLARALEPVAPRRSIVSIQRIIRTIQAAGLTDSEPPPPSTRVEPAERAHGSTIASWGTASHRMSPPAGRLWPAVLVALGALAGGAGVLWFVTRTAEEPAANVARFADVPAATATATAAAPTAPVTGGDPAPPVVTAVATATAEPVPTAAAAGTANAATRPPVRGGAAPRSTGTSPRAKPTAQPDVWDER